MVCHLFPRFDKTEGIVVIGATNFPEILDKYVVAFHLFVDIQIMIYYVNTCLLWSAVFVTLSTAVVAECQTTLIFCVPHIMIMKLWWKSCNAFSE